MIKRILSWNVNGIRAVSNKGFLEWFQKDQPDILCLQETKAHPDQLAQNLLKPGGYHSWFASAERKGYSGVAIYSKEKPVDVRVGLGFPEFDAEGRTLIADYGDFILYNIYFPNGKASEERLDYKMRFYEVFLQQIVDLKNQGKSIIFCGDVNTAHKEIDLARPKENETVSGFLLIEREWIDQVIQNGFIDTLREFKPEPELYTWWDYKTRARERNVGWRIDYFFISDNLRPSLKDAYILKDITGSDHCPLGIDLQI